MPAANRPYRKSAAWYAERRDTFMKRSRARTAAAVTKHVLRGDFPTAMRALNDGALTHLQWEQGAHPALQG